mmetsp:Transcript_12615/g.34414  ORF Transcript_12615/g.34414 Transcript_12615/m.34414 type:complete len:403 (+) Transcript_12615:63-1271(+)
MVPTESQKSAKVDVEAPMSLAEATKPPAAAEASSGGGSSAKVKWCVLAFLVLQNSGASILMRESRSAGAWSPQTAVIMQEAIKAVVCVFLLLRDGGLASVRGALVPSVEALKTSVPALLYLLQNNMQYVAVGYLDAATYAVLYQFKILTAALMSVAILRKALSLGQWFALIVLTGGASVVILSQMTGSAAGAAQQGGVITGVIAVLSACMASGLAGVYFEKLLKGSTMSLWARNLQLALYSLIVGFAGLYQEGGVDLLGAGFFRGYSTVVWAAIINNALGGLLIAVVIKHADTIMKNFSTTLSIILTMGFSTVCLGTSINAMSILGTALVVYAVFLYGGMTGTSAARGLAEAAKARALALKLRTVPSRGEAFLVTNARCSKEELDGATTPAYHRRRAEFAGA